MDRCASALVGAEPLDDLANEDHQIARLAMEFEPARRDAAHVEELGREFLQPGDLTIDDGEVLREDPARTRQRRLSEPARQRRPSAA